MHQISITIEIDLNGKWHSGAGEAGFFTDRLVRLDAQQRPYIPASTLRGVVREQCERLNRVLALPDCSDPHTRDSRWHIPKHELLSPVDHLFGTKYAESSLYFRDAKMADKPLYPFINVSRTAMYRALGTGRDKHLFQTQYANPAVLHSQISGWYEHLPVFDELPLAYILLLLGLQSIDRLGGDKSTGKGPCELKITEIEYNSRFWSWEECVAYIEEIFVLWDDYMEAEGL